MTEQEAKTLASELEHSHDWIVVGVEEWQHGDPDEWVVLIAHRLNPHMIFIHPGCFSGPHRNHDHRVY